MSPEALEDRYLDSLDCRCNPACQESWGECCGDCPECGEDEDERDYETEAEDKAERMADW